MLVLHQISPYNFLPKQLLRTATAHFFKAACANRSNHSDFVIRPNSFSQLSVAFKNYGYLASKLIDQHDRQTMTMAQFLQWFSTGMGRSRPPPRPSSSSCPAACHKLFLRRRRSFLELSIVKQWGFHSLPGSAGDGGDKKQRMIARHPWWVASR